MGARSTGEGSGAGSAPGLLAQHRRDARARRLRVACGTFGACVVALLVLSFVAEARGEADLTRLTPSTRPIGWIALGLSVVGVTLLGRTLRHDRSVTIATVLAGALGTALIAAIEVGRPWADTRHVMGVSMSCLWLLLLAVLSPLSPRATLAWTLSAASLGPITSLVAELLGVAQPPIFVVAYFWLPVFLAAITAASSAHALRDAQREARVLGPYRLIEPIAEGGMGSVWRAEHRLLDRPAAVKLIKLAAAESAGQDVLQKRFEREARITARLTSPHAVTLHDFGVADDGTLYYVMELLEGLSLQALVVEHGAQPTARAAALIAQACHAIGEAHRLGLLHRDIKPANLFLTRGSGGEDRLKVLDFGLSRPMSRAPELNLTRDGMVLGTPGYMAPEVALGRTDRVDGRADVYALGCVLYLLLTGEEVFEAKSGAELLRDHAYTVPLPPSSRARERIPEGLDGLVMRCLAKDPDLRPSSCEALAGLLESVAPPWTTDDARRFWRKVADAERSKHAA